jgi:D-beta-D-heptose 7-phosphate kinase/D-beta-D-heptose 1-phosphate adenosyltransferase
MLIVNDQVDHIRNVRKSGAKLVFTNGCFDILSRTHVDYLRWCKLQGDKLFIALNDDQSITDLKGEGRPFNPLTDRIAILNELKCVDYIMPFSGKRCDHIIDIIQPDVYVKGGDYTIDSLDKGELKALRACEADIRFAPNDNPRTTTDLVTKIRNLIDANIL